MTTNWNGPQNAPPGSNKSNLQFTRRRAAGLEQLSVILDDLAAEHGLPICTVTAGVVS